MSASFHDFMAHLGDPDNLAYFLIGVAVSGLVFGLTALIHARLLIKSLPEILLTFDRDKCKKR